MNLQTQYELDSTQLSNRNSMQETVAITIPAHDHNLLKEIARRFGWACMF